MTILRVTNTNDAGAGSLRQAIADASAGDTITFDEQLANKKITLSSGQLTINKDLTIDGSDAPGITISGNKSSRVLDISKGVEARLEDLVIVDGKSEQGGGIKVSQEGSKLTLIDSQVNNNVGEITGGLFVGWKSTANIINSSFNNNDGTALAPTAKNAGKSAGAISTWGSAVVNIENTTFSNNKGYNGGAIYSIFSTLSIEDSVFVDNISENRGGGGAIFNDGIGKVKGAPTPEEKIYISGSRFEGNQAEGQGGALSFWGYGEDNAIIEDSIIVNNEVTRNDDGKYGRGGAIKATNIGLTLRNTTIANNSAEGQGGGLWIEANSQTPPIAIINSTISGNQVTDDAGGGAFLNTRSTPVKITNSTIAYNDAGRANGALWFAKDHAITLTNSIVAFNSAQRDLRQQQVGYQPKDGGGNIEFSPITQANRVVPGSLVADPRLGALQEIDGALVHPLLSNSPAIDAGINKNAPATDQRGVARDELTDSGAFEASASVASELAAIGEFGTVSNLDHQSQTILLEQDYDNPVVFAQPLSNNEKDPSTVRITDIQGDRFSVYLQEANYQDGQHTQEKFSFFVAEAGTWRLADGTVLEVGTFNTDAVTTSGWETVNFNTSFDKSPVVLSQVQTQNDDDFVRTRQRNATAAGFQLAMEEEEALKNSGHQTEKIGWLAISPGEGDNDGFAYQAGTTGDKVTHNWHTLNFSQDFQQTPHLLASIATYDGADSVGLRYRSLSQEGVQLKAAEDTSKDSETKHTTEVVNFLAFAGDKIMATAYDPLTGAGESAAATEAPELVPQSTIVDNDEFVYEALTDNRGLPWRMIGTDPWNTLSSNVEEISLMPDASSN